MTLRSVACPIFLFSLIGARNLTTAQEKTPEYASETTIDVPALNTFHTVIYKLWHTAWPKKDYAMLIDLSPEIRQYVGDIAAAKLPGILRDKQAAWDRNVGQLQSIAEEYCCAATSKDNHRLLESAEKLHAQYEALVRTIRPVMKELETFHTTLYMLYHHYMPEQDLDNVKTSVTALQKAMAGLNVALLPERLKSKDEAFMLARTALSSSVNEVAKAVSADDNDIIKKAVDKMHSRYELLEKVFD